MRYLSCRAFGVLEYSGKLKTALQLSTKLDSAVNDDDSKIEGSNERLFVDCPG